MVILTNAFSINMLQGDITAKFTQLGPMGAAAVIVASGCVNAIGHADTDAVVREVLVANSGSLTLDGDYGIPKGQRINVSVTADDELIVAQYSGPRLPEGATQLPDGAAIKFWHVSFK